MRLETVSVVGQDGIKGWTGKWPLGGVDLVVGPNGAGKTSRILAILTGIRGIAETHTDATREYLGADVPAATVDLNFDTARLSRTLSEGARTNAGKRADGAAEAIAGPHLVRWDLRDFAAGTAEARQKLLDRVCNLGGAGWTIDQVRAECSSVDAELATELFRSVPAASPERFAAAAHEWCKGQFTAANAADKGARGEVAGLNEGDAEQVVAGSPEDYAKDLAEAQNKLADARAQNQRAERDQRAIDDHRRRLEQARADVARLEGDLGPEIDPVDIAAAQSTRDGAKAAEKAAQEAVNAQREVAGAARATLATVRRFAAFGEATCKHCGGEDPLGKGDEIEAAEQAVAAAELRLAELVDDAELEHAMHEGAVDALAAATRVQSRIEHRNRTAVLLEEARKRLRDLESFGAPVEVATAVDVAELEQRAAELGRARDRAVRAQERERAFQRAVERQEKAAERLAAVKAMGAKVKEVRERMAAEAFRPLEREASAITLPVLGGEVVFRSAAEFGLQRDGVYVGWWALSDGEQAIFAAGLSYAFSRLAGAPWRAVLLDGAEVVDPARLGRLLSVLVERKNLGELDNAVIAMRADGAPPVVPVGVTVTALRARQGAQAQGAQEAA